MSKKLVGEEWINSPQKRAMDVLAVSSLMPIAIPLGSAAIGLSRLIDGEGAIFRQDRVAKSGEIVTISKIRTYVNGRVTPYGRFLRGPGIDEIPQLLSILKGDMSLVGPRISIPQWINEMEERLPSDLFKRWHGVYSASKPGGISSYNLFLRSEDDDARDLVMRANMDIEDFEQASLEYDLSLLGQAGKICLRSLFREGIPT